MSGPSRLEDARSPDWDYWIGVGMVTVYDAVLLSVGYNPRVFARGVKVSDEHHEFFERLDMANGHIRMGTLPAIEDEFGHYRIALTAFVEWVSIHRPGWSLPHELRPPKAAMSKRAVTGDGAIGTKERTSFLRLIAAIVTEAEIDISSPYKVGDGIEATARSIGLPISRRKAGDVLKEVAALLPKKT